MRLRDLLTWTLYGLLRLSSRLPWSLRLLLGRVLGRAFYHLLRGPRHTARVNLGLVHPHLDEAAITELLRRHFIELGVGVFELGLAWWSRDEVLAEMVSFEGWEHIEAAQSSGRGVILLTPHCTNLELGGRFLMLRMTFALTFKPDKDPLIDRLIRTTRQDPRLHQIEADDVRGMLRALKCGEALWYAPDINFKGKGRVFAEFFGVPAATAPQPARIAAHGNALVVPYVPVRRPDGRYTVVIDPPLEGFPSGAVEADTQRMNTALEVLVRRCPDNYLWIMRRFRTRPDAGANPYR